MSIVTENKQISRSDKKIREAVKLMKSVWITAKNRKRESGLYLFTGEYNLKECEVLTLNISADTRYKLYFNGSYICEGPCQGDHWFWRYETVKIPRKYICDGINRIEAYVYYNGGDIYHTQARKDSCALIVFGRAESKGKVTEINTGLDWKCRFLDGYKFIPSQGVHVSMPPVQLITPDKATECEVAVKSRCLLENDCVDDYGLFDTYRLKKREIKLFAPGEAEKFRCVRQTESSSELDAGKYTTAYPEFTFKGKEGGLIRFTYAECYCNENGSKLGLDRSGTEGVIRGVYDEVVLTGEEQKFIPYFYKAFRFIKAEYPEGTVFEADNQIYSPYFYPVEGSGSYCSDSETENRMWEVSVNTLKCCTHETFVDCPYYEQCQYDMDTTLEATFMMRLTNDYSMPRKAVYDLARSQQPDGMLAAHYPAWRIQVIPTFSLFWILLLSEYVMNSGDTGCLGELLPYAERILSAFRMLKNEKGLVKATPYWHYTDWVDGWNGGVPPEGRKKPLTVTSMMLAYALKKAAELCEIAGRGALATEYVAEYKETVKAIEENCYDGEMHFYSDTPGGRTYSEHTAVWAVLSECKTGEDAKQLLIRSFEGNYSRASFSFSFYTFRALEKTGLYTRYAERIFDGWRKMLDMGCTTWGENPGNPRSECHAWSSAPIYEYSAVFLGVKPTLPGYRKFVVRPQIEMADNVRGSVPTPYGEIEVSLQKIDGALKFRVRKPIETEGLFEICGRTAVIPSGSGEFEAEFNLSK